MPKLFDRPGYPVCVAVISYTIQQVTLGYAPDVNQANCSALPIPQTNCSAEGRYLTADYPGHFARQLVDLYGGGEVCLTEQFVVDGGCREGCRSFYVRQYSDVIADNSMHSIHIFSCISRSRLCTLTAPLVYKSVGLFILVCFHERRVCSNVMVMSRLCIATTPSRKPRACLGTYTTASRWERICVSTRGCRSSKEFSSCVSNRPRGACFRVCLLFSCTE